MQAIQTKFIAPTNHRGARIKASCQAGSITVNYEYNADGYMSAHKIACDALRKKLEWTGKYYGNMVSGELPDGSVAWVFLPRPNAL